ncbi:MAG: glycosyltransferase family 39 protein [Elusimicrobia bacterium]|nr:glycosyltransferase family 39 protein [Elusimicrobiota bacterium]
MASFIKKFFSKKYSEHIIAGSIILISLFLGVVDLGNNNYWDDEAANAIFAKNYLATGTFTGWDGRNLCTYRNGGLLDKNLRSIEQPLGYIVAAAGFKLFGFLNSAGRFLFVLLGIASLLMLWLLLLEDFSKEPALRIYTLILTAFSYSFLLNIRQCRYYALCLFFGMAGYYLYRRAIKDDKLQWYLLSSIAFVLLFYSNALICAAMVFGIILVHMIFYARHFTLKKCIKVSEAILLFALLTVPYALQHLIWERYDHATTNLLVPLGIKEVLYRNLMLLDLSGYLPIGMLIIGILAAKLLQKKLSFPRSVYEWLVMILGYVLALSVISVKSGTGVAIRYFISLLPFCSGVIGTLLYMFHGMGYGRYIGIFFLVVLLSSNALSFHPPKKWLLPALITEFCNDYETPYDAAVHYLKTNARKDDIVYSYPEYTMNVLHFYLGDNLKMQGLLRDSSPQYNETLSWVGLGPKYTHLSREKLKPVNGLKYIDESYPDWIVVFDYIKIPYGLLKYFSRGSFIYEIDPQGKKYTILPVFGRDMTRPELTWHNFGPITRFDPRVNGVYIFRKTERKQLAKM